MAELQHGQPKTANLNTQEILEADEWYDLLPVEKKLIGFSLGLGVCLLVIFVFAFDLFK
ncbi:hypothetical protein [Desulfolucanica intricata]|uniref:hypothetical protein n=1 Tax=Desulfolucanica intricata TaxID=1285191 RepID=UPI000B11470D|nr:hypothetical protein [Desulfolucanica intricata]